MAKLREISHPSELFVSRVCEDGSLMMYNEHTYRYLDFGHKAQMTKFARLVLANAKMFEDAGVDDIAFEVSSINGNARNGNNQYRVFIDGMMLVDNLSVVFDGQRICASQITSFAMHTTEMGSLVSFLALVRHETKPYERRQRGGLYDWVMSPDAFFIMLDGDTFVYKYPYPRYRVDRYMFILE